MVSFDSEAGEYIREQSGLSLNEHQRRQRRYEARYERRLRQSILYGILFGYIIDTNLKKLQENYFLEM